MKCWSQGAAEIPACRYFSHLVTLTLRTKHSPKISPGGFKKNIIRRQFDIEMNQVTKRTKEDQEDQEDQEVMTAFWGRVLLLVSPWTGDRPKNGPGALSTQKKHLDLK